MSLEGQEAAWASHTLPPDSDDVNYELDKEQELDPVMLKEELELGPMVLQPPDAVCAFQASVTRPMEAARVKREPQWDSDDANYELDEEQGLGPVVLKEELELGPVVLQPPDAIYVFQETCANLEPSRCCHWDHTYAKTKSPKAKMLVKAEVVECLREAAREASAVGEEPADFVGPLERSAGLEARRGTGRAPNTANVGNQIHAKTDIDTEKGTFVCDICEQRFALKARLMEHVVIHIHSTEREESERGVADNASVTRPMEAARVKREPQWDSDDASEEQELDSVVLKEELELGPVVLQPPDAVYAFQALQKKEQTDRRTQAVPRRTCSVVLEPMLVDMELCVCKIGHQIYEFRSCPENDVSQSDEEFNSSKKFESPAQLRNKELKKGQAKTNKSKIILQKKNEKRKRKIIPNSDNSLFKCNQCSFKSSKSDLKIHLRTHTGEKPFECIQCSSAFSRRSHLLRHLRTHTGEKPFKCSLCSSAFTDKRNLQHHLRTHTGEKPFECNICDYKTTRSDSLKYHIMSRHSGQKPVGCDACSYRGATRNHLRQHMKVHQKQA